MVGKGEKWGKAEKVGTENGAVPVLRVIAIIAGNGGTDSGTAG